MLRRNIQKLKHVENLDVFPKIDAEYKQATASGGTGTILINEFYVTCNLFEKIITIISLFSFHSVYVFILIVYL